MGNTEDPTIFDVAQLDALPVQASVVASSTRSDPLLSKILAWLRTGWPTRVPEPFSQYWTRRNELTLQDNCILWGIRVVVPEGLRSQILTELHRGHPGIVRIKAVARSHVWWPGLDKDRRVCAVLCCLSSLKEPPRQGTTSPLGLAHSAMGENPRGLRGSHSRENAAGGRRCSL